MSDQTKCPIELSVYTVLDPDQRREEEERTFGIWGSADLIRRSIFTFQFLFFVSSWNVVMLKLFIGIYSIQPTRCRVPTSLKITRRVKKQ